MPFEIDWVEATQMFVVFFIGSGCVVAAFWAGRNLIEAYWPRGGLRTLMPWAFRQKPKKRPLTRL